MSASQSEFLRLPVLHGVPRTKEFDSTLRLLSEGYPFIGRRCAALGSDIFATRLMGRPAICVSGPEAARMFWQPGRFTRRGALPPATPALLQDPGGAHALEGEDHRHRKAMMMSLQTSGDRARMVAMAEETWRGRAARWPALRRVRLFGEAERVLCAAACRWAGIPDGAADLTRLTEEFSATMDGAGNALARRLRGLLLLRRSGRWARELVEAVRAGKMAPPPDSPLAVIARHRDRDEQALPAQVAAIELLNLLRPTVAVARYIVFGALAMHEYPEWRARIADGDDATLTMFAQEVRRFYPFSPAVGGRVSEAFDWRGLRFEEGTWVLFDLYGTNHDPALWPEPGRFRPERFAGWQSNGFDLVAQGAGDYLTGHRCPGEAMTLELVKSALHLLAAEVVYAVPRQDLSVDLARVPALPASGLVLDVAAPVR